MMYVENLAISCVLAMAVSFGLLLSGPTGASRSAYEVMESLTQAQDDLMRPYDLLADPAYLSSLTPEKRLSLRLQKAFDMDSERSGNFGSWIIEASRNEGIPVPVLVALISAESDFRYKAQSYYGAVGPTQVVPKYWSDQCEGNIVSDPRANVLCGAKVLGIYFDRCNGDISCSLAMYNTGPTPTIASPTASMDSAMTRYWSKIARGLQKFDPKLKANLGHTWRERIVASNNP